MVVKTYQNEKECVLARFSVENASDRGVGTGEGAFPMNCMKKYTLYNCLSSPLPFYQLNLVSFRPCLCGTGKTPGFLPGYRHFLKGAKK
jgi:hypothetical protein